LGGWLKCSVIWNGKWLCTTKGRWDYCGSINCWGCCRCLFFLLWSHFLCVDSVEFFLVEVDSEKFFEKENNFYQIFYLLLLWLDFFFIFIFLGFVGYHSSRMLFLFGLFFCCRGVSCRAYLSTQDLFCLIISHFHDCCPEQRYRQWETNNCIHTTFSWV
jgi:hypothetical protein